MRVPKRSFVFYSEIQIFENCTQMAIHSLITKSGILNVIPEWPFVFQKRKYEI